MAKIAESQTLILAKFAGKPEPNPVADMKMMRSTEDAPEELDYSNAPTKLHTRRSCEDGKYEEFIN